MPTPISRIIVVDANAPWVRWLFETMADRVDVDFLRVVTPHFLPRWGMGAFRWRRLGPRLREQWVPVPGWSKAGAISTAIVAQRCRRASSPPGRTAVVYSLPWYAGVAERLHGRVPQAYFAHDPFQFYAGWDAARVAANEDRLFKTCAAAAAISRQLARDFQARTSIPILYCPNAASRLFLQATPAVPADLAGLPGPIVGCVGQINESYDWDLIEQAARLLPQVSFVFIGLVQAGSAQMRKRIEQVLSGPNVRWLGWRSHDTLPAYLHHFAVCWNPMRVNEHNHRRSPLRLYDYLTTDRPVLSTPLSEVQAHEGLVATAAGPGAEETAKALKAMLAAPTIADAEARRRYLAANTWEERGRQFLAFLEANL